jgi:hypothetical protein
MGENQPQHDLSLYLALFVCVSGPQNARVADVILLYQLV